MSGAIPRPPSPAGVGAGVTGVTGAGSPSLQVRGALKRKIQRGVAGSMELGSAPEILKGSLKDLQRLGLEDMRARALGRYPRSLEDLRCRKPGVGVMRAPEAGLGAWDRGGTLGSGPGLTLAELRGMTAARGRRTGSANGRDSAGSSMESVEEEDDMVVCHVIQPGETDRT